MARTKASVGAKVSFGKSSKVQKTTAAPSPSSSGRSNSSSKRASRSGGGGNPYCPRETPDWQQPITRFFGGNYNGSDSHPTSSAERPHDSDAEHSCAELDDSRLTCVSGDELEPLVDDESSHKVDEYFPKISVKPMSALKCSSKTGKNKGVGKSSKNVKHDKENAEPDTAAPPERKRASDAEDTSENKAKKMKI